MVGGDPATVTIAPNDTRMGLTMSGDGWAMSLATMGRANQATPIARDNTLLLTQGSTLKIRLSGFAPNSKAIIYLMSSLVVLGTITTNAAGEFFGSVSVPSPVPVGAHTAQINGFAVNGKVLSASLGVRVESAESVHTRRVLVYFKYLSATLTPAMQTSLRALVAKIPEGSSVSSVIVGLVRATGARSSDRALLRARAKAVAVYLKKINTPGRINYTSTATTTETTAAAHRVNLTIQYTA